MMKLLCASLCAALPAVAIAGDAPQYGWTGAAELGLAVTRGNSHSENFNGKLALLDESADWTHKFAVEGVRARARVSGDFDDDGVIDQRDELSANRYQLSASSGYRMTPRASWIGALRHEDDDFSAFDYQTTFSLGYGYRWLDDERSRFSAELGPGYRRAKRAVGDVETDLILRGVVEYRHALTPNTALTNKLLVESGDDNRFAQNDFGIAVAMNSRLALKTGVQLRHNSEVADGARKTDTLTTVNLVYTLH
jgi:putative salt-induced outer membrane protein